MNPKILIVDDEPNMVALFKRFLGKQGYSITGAGNVAEGSEALQKEVFDVVISDLAMPDGTGIDLLKIARKAQPHVPFILITAYGSIESAVEAIKLGAYDYISKPFQNEEMKILIDKALQHSDLNRRVKYLQKEVSNRYGFDNIIGRSKTMKATFDLVEKIAPTNSTILISGESGTGKELFAKAIHYNSNRKERPFVAIDCGVIPENLIESELFGHTKGAFTGAETAKRGLFDEAHTGTIFLDEIGNLHTPLQAKLLRVLQEREFKPLGSTETRSVDVRVIAATKENLREAVEQGTFRNDLFYRLSVIPLEIPPLRERQEDIPLLTRHFLDKVCSENKMATKQLVPEVINQLMEYSWPGNVRELENLIERLVLISHGDTIGPESLPPEITEASALRGATMKDKLGRKVAGAEKEMILDALERAGGNRTKAARLLGISRASLYNKLNQYDIG